MDEGQVGRPVEEVQVGCPVEEVQVGGPVEEVQVGRPVKQVRLEGEALLDSLVPRCVAVSCLRDPQERHTSSPSIAGLEVCTHEFRRKNYILYTLDTDWASKIK